MTNPNDPAFPAIPKTPYEMGLSKREYFSVMAMIGILACGKNMPDDQTIQGASCTIADALIRELSKPEEA